MLRSELEKGTKINYHNEMFWWCRCFWRQKFRDRFASKWGHVTLLITLMNFQKVFPISLWCDFNIRSNCTRILKFCTIMRVEKEEEEVKHFLQNITNDFRRHRMAIELRLSKRYSKFRWACNYVPRYFISAIYKAQHICRSDCYWLLLNLIINTIMPDVLCNCIMCWWCWLIGSLMDFCSWDNLRRTCMLWIDVSGFFKWGLSSMSGCICKKTKPFQIA